jgi:hypothetical protein
MDLYCVEQILYVIKIPQILDRFMKSTVGLYLSVKEASDKLGLFTVKEREIGS